MLKTHLRKMDLRGSGGGGVELVLFALLLSVIGPFILVGWFSVFISQNVVNKFLLIDWLLPFFPVNNCFSASIPAAAAAADEIALFFMFIFAMSLAFFIIASTVKDWFGVVGLALDQLEFDERWLLLLAGDDDDMTEEADGLVTEPFVVADEAIATLRFNESGLVAAPVVVSLPIFTVSDETMEGGTVMSSFELVFRGLESSFLSWTMSLVLPRKCWLLLLILIDNCCCCCRSKYDWIAFFWNAFNVGFGTRCVLLGSRYVYCCCLLWSWVVDFCCCFSSSLIRSATDCQLWLLGDLRECVCEYVESVERREREKFG